MESLRGSLFFLFFVATSFLLSGCRPDPTSRQFAEKTTGGSAGQLAGPPSQGEIHFSKYKPKIEFHELARGLLSKSVFDTAKGAAAIQAQGYRVEVRTVMVGPSKSTEEATLPGGAVFEVRSGNGTINIGGSTREIDTGSTFGVSEGEPFRLANESKNGLALRVYVIRLK